MFLRPHTIHIYYVTKRSCLQPSCCPCIFFHYFLLRKFPGDFITTYLSPNPLAFFCIKYLRKHNIIPTNTIASKALFLVSIRSNTMTCRRVNCFDRCFTSFRRCTVNPFSSLLPHIFTHIPLHFVKQVLFDLWSKFFEDFSFPL